MIYLSFDQTARDCVSFLKKLKKVLVKMVKYVEDNPYVSNCNIFQSLTAVNFVVEMVQEMLKVFESSVCIVQSI